MRNVFMVRVQDSSMSPLQLGTIASFEPVYGEEIKLGELYYVRLLNGAAVFGRFVGASPGRYVLRQHGDDFCVPIDQVEYFARHLGSIPMRRAV